MILILRNSTDFYFFVVDKLKSYQLSVKFLMKTNALALIETISFFVLAKAVDYNKIDKTKKIKTKAGNSF